MEIINLLIGTPLGYLMYFCLALARNYGVAILLFTLLTRIIILPLSLLAQKNSIKMVKMMPALQDIQKRHAGNKALIAEEQRKLHKKEHYSTVVGLLPLLIQIPIILGLIAVIYNPLTHLFHIDASLTHAFIQQAMDITGRMADDMGAGAQLFTLQAIQQSPNDFAHLAGSEEAIRQILSMDTSFLGLDLLVVPTFTNPELMIALASAMSALLLSLVQNRFNVLQVNAGFLSKYGMMIFLIVFSGYFAFILPASLGLYWTATNLIAIPILFFCNLVYSPKAYMTPEIKACQHRLSHKEKSLKRAAARELARRSKADKRRFEKYAKPKELVMYSEASGFFKYYKGLIKRLVDHTDITIHYLTSDPADQVFDLEDERIHCYYQNDRMLISTLMRLDADVMVMTTPDLETYHLKRSLARKDIEYIYLDHGFGSINLSLREHALDHFDTVFCYGPHYVEEIREIEFAYQLPQKTLVKTGLELFDELSARARVYQKLHKQQEEKAASSSTEPTTDAPAAKDQVIIAPSWQPDNILESCAEPLVQSLLNSGLKVVVRPHPEFVKRFPEKVDELKQRFSREHCEDFVLQEDFSDNSTLYLSNLLITDWSTISMEFCYTTKQPVLFINTPPKISNPEYQRIPLKPIDLILRDELGVSLDLDKVHTAGECALQLIGQKDQYKTELADLFEGLFYDIDNGMQSGADYLAVRVADNRVRRGRA